MSVARVTELIAESSIGFDDAVAQGVARANATLRNVSGAWVDGQKVVITDGKVTAYRVILKVTFILDD